MKKLILIFIVSVFTTSVLNAQEKKDTSLDKVALSICDCISKRGVEKVKTKEEAEQLFLNCLIDSAMDKMMLLMGNDSLDENAAGEEFGKKLGVLMLKNGCKPFVTLSLKLAGADKDESNVASVRETKSIEGKVTEVIEGDFLTIKLKASNGRDYEFIYTSYIEGSDTWLKEPQTKLKGKNIKVQWKETEMYQPKKKDFINLKELVAVVIKK